MGDWTWFPLASDFGTSSLTGLPFSSSYLSLSLVLPSFLSILSILLPPQVRTGISLVLVVVIGGERVVGRGEVKVEAQQVSFSSAESRSRLSLPIPTLRLQQFTTVREGSWGGEEVRVLDWDSSRWSRVECWLCLREEWTSGRGSFRRRSPTLSSGPQPPPASPSSHSTTSSTSLRSDQHKAEHNFRFPILTLFSKSPKT